MTKPKPKLFVNPDTNEQPYYRLESENKSYVSIFDRKEFNKYAGLSDDLTVRTEISITLKKPKAI